MINEPQKRSDCRECIHWDICGKRKACGSIVFMVCSVFEQKKSVDAEDEQNNNQK